MAAKVLQKKGALHSNPTRSRMLNLNQGISNCNGGFLASGVVKVSHISEG